MIMNDDNDEVDDEVDNNHDHDHDYLHSVVHDGDIHENIDDVCGVSDGF